MKMEELVVTNFTDVIAQKIALNIFRSIDNTDELSTSRVLNAVDQLMIFSVYERDFNNEFSDLKWNDPEVVKLLNDLTVAGTALYDYFNKDELTDECRKACDFVRKM